MRRRPHPHRSMTLLVVAMVLLTVVGAGTSYGGGVAGSAGTDVSLPNTDSQVTVNGRGRFAGVTFSINQTRNLVNQAISVNWTGAQPTRIGPGRYAANYMQIFQCWGDDDGSNPANPGPPPQQCEQGALGGTYGGSKGEVPGGFAMTRVISRTGWPNYNEVKSYAVTDPGGINTWMPFRSVDGTVVGYPVNPSYNINDPGAAFWLNQYYSIYSTNEVAGARNADDGTGGTQFQVLTGIESSGLGCGQRVEPAAGGGFKVPRCWLVIVPRGLPFDENAGTPSGSSQREADLNGVVTSPLAPNAWANRIAVPLEFNSVDSPCALGAKERRMVGTELVLNAVASWQPTLCSMAGLPPYSYAIQSDGGARQQLATPAPGAPGMVVVGRPLGADQLDPTSPVVYAPLTLSGIVIGFNWERTPRLDAPPEEVKLNSAPIAIMNLTPRLVAKLLTQSYKLGPAAVNGPPGGAAYGWLSANPQSLGDDQDFTQWNPEFALLTAGSPRNVAGLTLPGGTSDAARAVWEWVLADPEAKAWLDGQPDQWGMKVNPVYSTNPAVNANGLAFADPVPESFPKADPYCFQGPKYENGVTPSPLCGTDWLPYANTLQDSAKFVRNADDRAKVVVNAFPISPQDAWTSALPQAPGLHSFLAVTDTASAAQFGIQTARLSRAGDDGAARSFVAANDQSLRGGAAALVPSTDPTFLVPDQAKSAPGAYPLTAVSYAAIKPLALDRTARSHYAAFLSYAAGAGQTSGLLLGQLPRGYTPLPDAFRAQVGAAATTVVDLRPPPVDTTTSPSPTPVGAPPPTSGATSPRGSSAGTSSGGAISAAGATGTSPPNAAPSVARESGPPQSAMATPILTLGGSRFVFLGIFVSAASSALLALEITKRPRRARPGSAAAHPEGAPQR